MELKYCGGGILVNLDKEILAVTNQTDETTLPSGECKNQELLREAALRELAEESGIPARQIHIVSYLGMLVRKDFTAESSSIPSVEKRIAMFLAQTACTELDPANRAPNIVSVQWFSLDQLDILSWPQEIFLIKKHQARIQGLDGQLVKD